MPADAQSKYRAELAEFLRVKRAALQPGEVGIVGGPRRRVPGLRRYEVADLACVSDTWYTWLEQGRDMQVSPDMIDGVCHALRLTAEERRYVRRLIGRPLVDLATDSPKTISRERLDVLRVLLDDLLPSAANIGTASWDILAWNSVYARLLGDPELLPPGHRNFLWKTFMTETVRSRVVDWELEANMAVARVRAEEAWLADDGPMQAMVDELLELSEDFRRAWKSHHVQSFVGYIARIDHPEVGEISAHLIRSTILEQRPLVMWVYVPADAVSRDRMERLAADT